MRRMRKREKRIRSCIAQIAVIKRDDADLCEVRIVRFMQEAHKFIGNHIVVS